MITELQVDNFKCFQKSPTFEFSKLNLLTGINGRGKSTLLQTLLVLSQTALKDSRFASLVINDPWVRLGDFDDIKNSDTARGTDITFRAKTDDISLQEAILSYEENEFDSFSASLSSLSIKSNNQSHDFDVKKLRDYETLTENIELIKPLWNLVFSVHYVSADRLGPAKYFDKISLDLLQVGARGEYAINILANDNLPLVNEILYRGKDARTVVQQTEEWLSYVLEGASIEIRGKEKESSVLSMLLTNRSSASKYKSVNVGFGYSYVLPLIVVGLIAQPGEIIIIENPEAHLHPRAQSKIAEFFAKVSSCGVQVFIESHSEHILNGIRVSTLDPEINVKTDDVSIQYFNEDFISERLIIDAKGKIANWPYGFFDQQEIDLANIFKHSRK